MSNQNQNQNQSRIEGLQSGQGAVAELLGRANSQLAGLPVYQPGRPIEEVARELGLDPSTVIKMASNENPLGPSPKAVEAMRAALGSVHLYPDGNAFYLKRQLAASLQVGTDRVVLGNGSNDILEFVGHAFLRPGAEVVASQYCFAVYPIVTHLFGAKYVETPAKDYGHDLDAMAAAITPATRIVFVANPNNPTGTLADSGAVLRFLDKVPRSVLVVMDEAYYEFLERPLDLLPLIRGGAYPNLLLARTFSKIYGLAGLRLGYGIGHPEVVSLLEKIRQPFNVNLLAQAGALAALGDLEHVARSRDNNTAGLRYFEGELKRLGLEFIPSQANFLLVRVGKGQEVFVALQKAGVIVRPMAGYRLPEWVRISIGTPSENRRCVESLEAILRRP